jgi:hypothetical protein
MAKKKRIDIRMRSVSAALAISCAVLLQGCSDNCKNEPAVPVKPKFFTDQEIQIVVHHGSPELKQSTLTSVQTFFKDTLGLDTQVSGVDLEIPSGVIPTDRELFDAAKPVLEHAHAPTLVIIPVAQVKDFQGYGWIIQGETSYTNGEKYPIAVVGLVEKDMMIRIIEWPVLKHEIGHWLGVPARKCHLYKDNSHCTSLRCIMTSGPGSNVPRWLGSVGLSILFMSPPDFCDNCKYELSLIKPMHEMKL